MKKFSVIVLMAVLGGVLVGCSTSCQAPAAAAPAPVNMKGEG